MDESLNRFQLSTAKRDRRFQVAPLSLPARRFPRPEILSQNQPAPPAVDTARSLAERLRSPGRAIIYAHRTLPAWPRPLLQESSAREAEKLRHVALAWPHVSCDQ